MNKLRKLGRLSGRLAKCRFLLKHVGTYRKLAAAPGKVLAIHTDLAIEEKMLLHIKGVRSGARRSDCGDRKLSWRQHGNACRCRSGAGGAGFMRWTRGRTMP